MRKYLTLALVLFAPFAFSDFDLTTETSDFATSDIVTIDMGDDGALFFGLRPAAGTKELIRRSSSGVETQMRTFSSSLVVSGDVDSSGSLHTVESPISGGTSRTILARYDFVGNAVTRVELNDAAPFIYGTHVRTSSNGKYTVAYGGVGTPGAELHLYNNDTDVLTVIATGDDVGGAPEVNNSGTVVWVRNATGVFVHESGVTTKISTNPTGNTIQVNNNGDIFWSDGSDIFRRVSGVDTTFYTSETGSTGVNDLNDCGAIVLNETLTVGGFGRFYVLNAPDASAPVTSIEVLYEMGNIEFSLKDSLAQDANVALIRDTSNDLRYVNLEPQSQTVPELEDNSGGIRISRDGKFVGAAVNVPAFPSTKRKLASAESQSCQ